MSLYVRHVLEMLVSRALCGSIGSLLIYLFTSQYVDLIIANLYWVYVDDERQ